MQQQIFSKKASEFWQINGAFKTLHDINPIRLNYIQTWLEVYQKDIQSLNILDCGSGAGILTESLAKLGACVTGIDISKEVIAVAKQHAKKNQLKIDYQAIEIAQFKQKIQAKKTKPDSFKGFDAITCLEMLEHVSEPEKIISHLSSLLKKDGLLFLSTLNRNPKSFISAIALGEYITNTIPKGTHQYQEFIKPSEIDQVCRLNQLELVHLSGLIYNPITREAKLTQDTSVNYLACYLKH